MFYKYTTRKNICECQWFVQTSGSTLQELFQLPQQTKHYITSTLSVHEKSLKLWSSFCPQDNDNITIPKKIKKIIHTFKQQWIQNDYVFDSHLTWPIYTMLHASSHIVRLGQILHCHVLTCKWKMNHFIICDIMITVYFCVCTWLLQLCWSCITTSPP